jgi:hypothetical protein
MELMVKEWHREFQLVPAEVMHQAVEWLKRKMMFAPSMAEVRSALRSIYQEVLLKLLDWNTLREVGYIPKDAEQLLFTMRGILPYATETQLECINIHEVPGLITALEKTALEQKNMKELEERL